MKVIQTVYKRAPLILFLISVSLKKMGSIANATF